MSKFIAVTVCKIRLTRILSRKMLKHKFKFEKTVFAKNVNCL